MFMYGCCTRFAEPPGQCVNIESVKNWRFEPGKKDGRGVAVEIAVEVDFRLY